MCSSDLSVVKDCGTITHCLDVCDAGTGEQHCRTATGLLAHDVVRFLHAGRFEPGERLVEQEEVRSAHERHPERESLGRRCGVVVRRSGGVLRIKTHPIEYGFRGVVGVLRAMANSTCSRPDIPG